MKSVISYFRRYIYKSFRRGDHAVRSAFTNYPLVILAQCFRHGTCGSMIYVMFWKSWCFTSQIVRHFQTVRQFISFQSIKKRTPGYHLHCCRIPVHKNMPKNRTPRKLYLESSNPKLPKIVSITKIPIFDDVWCLMDVCRSFPTKNGQHLPNVPGNFGSPCDRPWPRSARVPGSRRPSPAARLGAWEIVRLRRGWFSVGIPMF